MVVAECEAVRSGKQGPAGFYMIKSLHAENFRCFKELDLSDLRRVNVVVGKNATGKTALLEAIKIAVGGTPAVLWGLNQSRGFFGGVPQPITRENFESLWSPYFFNFDSSKPITTDCCNSEDQHATVKIFFDAKKSVTVIPQQQPQQQPTLVPPSVSIPPVAFERSGFGGATSTLYATVLAQGQLNFDQGPELGIVAEFFPSSAFSFNPLLPVQLFSQASLQQHEKEVFDAVKAEFEPALQSLVVLSPTGTGQTGIYVGLPYLKEKLPVGNLSAGVSRFIAMLSAVLIRSKGVLLIDEIENGLSYKVFPALWKYLLKFAVDNNSQIFASTHSLECVQALGPAMEGHENDFTLLRAERVNGSSGVTRVEGKFLEAAIDQGVEVR